MCGKNQRDLSCHRELFVQVEGEKRAEAHSRNSRQKEEHQTEEYNLCGLSGLQPSRGLTQKLLW